MIVFFDSQTCASCNSIFESGSAAAPLSCLNRRTPKFESLKYWGGMWDEAVILWNTGLMSGVWPGSRPVFALDEADYESVCVCVCAGLPLAQTRRRLCRVCRHSCTERHLSAEWASPLWTRHRDCTSSEIFASDYWPLLSITEAQIQ